MATTKKRVGFAMCVANEGYDDLEVWKVYQVLPDAKAGGVACIRIIDDSGEDYLYPADCFIAVNFPGMIPSKLPKWQSGRGDNVLQAAAKSRRRLRA
jgi:hypothetical protein